MGLRKVGGVEHVCEYVLLCGASVREVWDACRPANYRKARSSELSHGTKYGI
jgi:hypothetical protein